VAGSFRSGGLPGSVAVRDFNRDRHPDLAVTHLSRDVSLLLGSGTGRFGAARRFPAGEEPFSLAVGDFNGDRDPDLAVANFSSDNVSVLLNTTFTCGGRRATLVARPRSGPLRGTPGPDVIVGSRRADVIDGRGGPDRISACGGDDRIVTAEGRRDRVDCGPGHDRVSADRIDRITRCERVRLVGRHYRRIASGGRLPAR
jgi:FG-GAP-like repeat/RTX calcium-binding nonapeptide repeat (4 copies)